MNDFQEPVTVLILSRNRPIFLWACLDAIFRYTSHPAKFVLVDNNSTDMGVRDVVGGFERRGMFDAVEWHTENHPKRVLEAVQRYRTDAGEYIVVIESDVVVFDHDPCWLTRMRELMDKHPALGLLGSYVDKRDFVEFDDVRTVHAGKSEAEINLLIKRKSLERKLPEIPPNVDLIEPFNPPGRLIMARKSALAELVFATDGNLYKHAKEVGIKAQIATTVRHRHLSLLNAFDYPDYDMAQRNAFFAQNNTGTKIIDT